MYRFLKIGLWLIIILHSFVIPASSLCFQNSLSDSASVSSQNKQDRSAELSLNAEKSQQRPQNAVEWMLKWGIPALFVGIILALFKLVTKQFKENNEQFKENVEQKITVTLQELKNINAKIDARIDKLEKQISHNEFMNLREGLYRELDNHFGAWQGIGNCIEFNERDRAVIQNISLFLRESYGSLLNDHDLLLLAIFWDIHQNEYLKALDIINKIFCHDNVPDTIKSSCYIQKVRILVEHNKYPANLLHEMLEKARKLNPQNISAFFLDARIYHSCGLHENAAHRLEDAINLPRATLYPINLTLTLADVYISLKEFDKALGLIESYLIVYPFHVKSIKSKASIYYSHPKIDMQIVKQFLEQILSVNIADDPELDYAAALLECRLKSYQDAIKRLHKIIRKRDNFIEYRGLLAEIYLELEMKDELIETIREIKLLTDDEDIKRKIDNVIKEILETGITTIKRRKKGRIVLKY